MDFLHFVHKNLELLSRGGELSLAEKVRLKFITQRYKSTFVRFGGRQLLVPDVPSFIAAYTELFIKKIYTFRSKTADPLIIDCGANIGLGVLFFKSLYPQSRIIAFEPDPKIHAALVHNIKAFGLRDVEAHQSLVWKEDTTMRFVSEGGLSGRLYDEAQDMGKPVIEIPAVSIKKYLQQPVAFLKIDIEGAEYEVLKDCRDSLGNVEHIFVEYHSMSGQPQHLDEILTILSRAGFRYHIHEAYTSPHPYMQVKSLLNMDLQLNIYGYRE